MVQSSSLFVFFKVEIRTSKQSCICRCNQGFLTHTLTLSFQTNNRRWLRPLPRSSLSPRRSPGATGGSVGWFGSAVPPAAVPARRKWTCDWECSNTPRKGGSQVHRLTCLLQSPAKTHHLACNTIWHATLPKFTPFPRFLHWFPTPLPLLQSTLPPALES